MQHQPAVPSARQRQKGRQHGRRSRSKPKWVSFSSRLWLVEMQKSSNVKLSGSVGGGVCFRRTSKRPLSVQEKKQKHKTTFHALQLQLKSSFSKFTGISQSLPHPHFLSPLISIEERQHSVRVCKSLPQRRTV